MPLEKVNKDTVTPERHEKIHVLQKIESAKPARQLPERYGINRTLSVSHLFGSVEFDVTGLPRSFDLNLGRLFAGHVDRLQEARIGCGLDKPVYASAGRNGEELRLPRFDNSF